MFSLRDVGVLPHNFLTFDGVIIGSTIEAILLSFALADQINTFRKESIQAVFEKEIVLKEQNSELERLVDQRTQEINQNMIRIEIQNNEKEILLKEIHHRVKNNLQIITSLLSLQNQNIEEVVLKQIFTSSQMRIKSMAIIHELLYQSNNFSKIDYQDYLQHLSQSLLDSYGQPNQDISLHIDAHAIQFNLETAIPLGLIINEAVTNSLKHGFKDRAEGILKISVELMEKELYKMTIEDNGIGIPKDFNLEKSKSLGTNLMNKLVRQLEGNVTVESGYSGTALHFLFKQID
jgi:two-component sensor histidine kinase